VTFAALYPKSVCKERLNVFAVVCLESFFLCVEKCELLSGGGREGGWSGRVRY